MTDNAESARARTPTEGSAMVGLLAVAVAFDFYGFYAGFFARAYTGAPVPIALLSYLVNAALVLWLPFARGDATALRRTRTLIWVLIAWSAGGVALTPLLAPARDSILPALTILICAAALRAGRTNPTTTTTA